MSIGGIETVSGGYNQSTKRLLELLDPQQKNLFEMLIFPSNIGISDPLQFLSANLDAIVSKLYIQTMQIPFASLEYARADKFQYVTNIIPPDEVTFTLIENEAGIVRTYIDTWVNEIYTEPILSSFTNTTSWEFKANQAGSEKNALIILQTGQGVPSMGVIKMEGLKFKNIGGITIGHSEGDPLLIELTCKVDNVFWMTFG